jgi:small subunit ribosomal protein S19e
LSVFDVPAAALIKVVAADLRKQGIEQPEWTAFVKTGQHRERSPDSPDWFFERLASVLYRVYKQGPLGTESLRSYYGGKKRRGVKRPVFRKASGKVVRVCLQQLEKQGLVKKDKKGRVVTGKGQAYLNSKAKEAGEMAKKLERERTVHKEEKHGEKTDEEKKVEAALKKQEKAVKDKERAKEEEKKKEKKKEEKKKEEKAEKE